MTVVTNKCSEDELAISELPFAFEHYQKFVFNHSGQGAKVRGLWQLLGYAGRSQGRRLVIIRFIFYLRIP